MSVKALAKLALLAKKRLGSERARPDRAFSLDRGTILAV